MSGIKSIKNKILIGSVALGAVMMPVVTGVASVSGLTYQNNTDVSFTFNPVLSVSISDDLTIADLAPGTFADSNTVQVTVSTNNAYGYTLSATVGDTENNLSDELRHSAYASTGDPIFSSIATNADLARATFSSDATYDNKWGLSTSNDGSTWGNYNGLPITGGESSVLLLTSDYTPTNGTASKYVRIGARASSTQSSGTYTNKINFVAVGGIAPVSLETSYASAGKTKLNGYYKMQDMNSSICDAVEVEDDQLQVVDTRDNKIYWIAKLKDGHCWMTQNLDLDLGVATLTHNSTTLYHDDTDLGWGSDTATTSWTPTRSTIHATSGTISGWTSDDNTPYSVDTGDYYYSGYDGTNLLPSTETNYLTVAKDANGDVINSSNSNVYFSTDPSRVNGGTHQHVGNYYNWSAAVASNDTSEYDTSTYDNVANNPQNSICPAGWRLPVITSYSSSSVGTNEFANLNYYYNNSATNTSAGLEKSPLFFARGGFVFSSSLFQSGLSCYYWSSTVDSSSGAYDLYFSATYVRPSISGHRYSGSSVRCLAR